MKPDQLKTINNPVGTRPTPGIVQKVWCRIKSRLNTDDERDMTIIRTFMPLIFVDTIAFLHVCADASACGVIQQWGRARGPVGKSFVRPRSESPASPTSARTMEVWTTWVSAPTLLLATLGLLPVLLQLCGVSASLSISPNSTHGG